MSALSKPLPKPKLDATTLVWRVRAETLQLNLDRVDLQWRSLPGLRAEFADLDSALDQLSAAASATSSQIYDWYRRSNDRTSPSITGDEFMQAITDIDRGLIQRLKAVRDSVCAVRSKSFLIEEESIATTAGKRLKGDGEVVKEQLNASSVRTPTKDDWLRFQRAEEASNAIFHECIDVLGGMVLRDAQFDTTLWQLADELLATYQQSAKDAGRVRAIPKVVQTVVTRLERVVRLWVPHWSIWALPFTAHEFWHVAASLGIWDKLREHLDPEEHSKDPALNTCLADAFATYTIGPAYAYAAVTLLLNPSAPYEPTWGCDECRAQAIFCMLEQMNHEKSEDDDKPSFLEPRCALEQAWRAAKQQAGVAPQPAKDHRDRVRAMVEALWRALFDQGCSTITLQQWRDLRNLAPLLLAGDLRQIALPASTEARDILNAGWLVRLDRTMKLEKLTDRVNQLLGILRETSPAAGNQFQVSLAGRP
jgi:hypothetical protein